MKTLIYAATLGVAVVMGFGLKQRDHSRPTAEAGLLRGEGSWLGTEIGPSAGEQDRLPIEEVEVVADGGGGRIPLVFEDSLWEELDEARRSVEELRPSHRALPQNAGVKYFAFQPRQDLSVRFLDNGGVRIDSGGNDGSWKCTLRLEGGGGAAPVKAGDTRVEVPHSPDLVEWYENGNGALEHGFLVGSPEVDMSGAPGVQIRISLEGMAVAKDPDRPGDLVFLGDEGEEIVGYRGLKVFDRDGKEILASMHPTGEGFEIAVHDAGAAYPLTVDPELINLQQTLLPTVYDPIAPAEEFGFSVALDGETAVVGAPSDPSPGGDEAGSAYVFRQSKDLWGLQQKLTGNPGGKRFGTAVAVSGDVLVVGSTDIKPGSAHVYRRTGFSWVPEQQLGGNDVSGIDLFGSAVSISGNRLVVGAPLGDTGAGVDTGSAYVFTSTPSPPGATWNLSQELEAGDAAIGDSFGNSVSVSGDTVLVGSPSDDTPAGAQSGSAYVFNRSGASWVEWGKLPVTDPTAGDRFGTSVFIEGGRLVIGAPFDGKTAGNRTGTASVYSWSGALWSEEKKIEADDAAAGDQFGYAVALSGNTLVLGAPAADGGAGSAYVFAYSGTKWGQQEKLVAIDPPGSDHGGLGRSVGIQGEIAMVGATPDGGAGENAAYIFTRTGTTWSQAAKLNLPDDAIADRFGASVAVFDETVAVGAYLDDTPAGPNAGTAYIFTRTGSTWGLQQKLESDHARPGDEFGGSVSLSGNSVLIGVGSDDTDAGNDAGSAFVFRRSGATWAQEQWLTASDADAGDRFGGAASISGDSLVVGADSDGNSSGSVYVFVRSGATWSEQQKLTAGDAASQDLFGQAVGIAGETIVVGAPGDDTPQGSGSGSAYVFGRSGTTWNEVQKLLGADTAGSDRFGSSVCLSEQENSLAVGAERDDTVDGSDAGSVYVFARPGATWSQQQQIVAGDASAGDRFGTAVSLYEDFLLVGAPFADQAGGSTAGAGYLFSRAGATWSALRQFVGAAGERLGQSVSVHESTGAMGASRSDTSVASESGSVQIFLIPGLALSATQFVENLVNGSAVSSISAGGTSAGWAFSLVGGSGSEDNHLFSVAGSDLQVASLLDHEVQATRSVRLRAVKGARTHEEAFTLTVLDDRTEDADGDGLTEAQEEDVYGSSDTSVDSDGDGIHDNTEVAARLRPGVADTALLGLLWDHREEFGLAVDQLAIGIRLDGLSAAGEVTLAVDFKAAIDGAAFVDLPAQESDVRVNAEGDIEFEFPPLGEAAFYRVIPQN